MSRIAARLAALFTELKRRRVFRVAGVYAVVAWVLIQAAATIFPALHLPAWTVTLVVVLAFFGFPVAVVLAWAFDMTPEGVRRTEAPAPGPGKAAKKPARRRMFALLGAGLVLALISYGVYDYAGWPGHPAEASVVPGAEVVAVVPFTTSGEGVERLGTGMMDLLATNLDAVGAIRTVSPRTVMHRWQRRAGEQGRVGLAGALAVAREVGAGSVLLGSIVGIGPHVRISTELHSIEGQTLARVRVEGPKEALLALVDSVSIRLLRDVWRTRAPIPELRVSAVTTGSLEAIRAYLEGLRHFRRTRWDAAITAFERAVAHDSTFALAYMRLAQAHGWETSTVAARPYRLAAARHMERLPARERALLRANLLFFTEGDIAALDSARAYTTRYPDDPAGWFLRGEIALHARPLLATSPEDIYTPFERVLELDPSYAPALIHPIWIAIQTGDTARLDRYLERYRRRASPEGIERYRLARTVIAAPPDAAARLMSGLLRSWIEDPGSASAGAIAALDRHMFLSSPAAWRATAEAVTPPLPGHPWSRPWRITWSGFWAASGRTGEAVAVLEPLPEAHRVLMARLTPVLAGYAPVSDAGDVLDRLAAVPPADTMQYFGGVYLRALIPLSRGDAAGARRILRTASAADRTRIPESMRGRFTALDGWIRLAEGDTLAGLQLMKTGLENTPWDEARLTAPIRFARASALAARPETRERGLERLRYGFVRDPAYLPLAYLRIGEALEAAGDRQGAARAYARVLRIWSDADPALESRVGAVRRRLARLTSEG